VNGTYEPLRARAAWAQRALVVAILVEIASLLSDGAQYSLVQRANWGGVTLSEVQANDQRQTLVGYAQLIVFVATAVFFLRWFRRAYANAPALGAVQPRWTPAWAVGYWFVPIYSLIRPKQIANEIWESAEPGGRRRLVDFWWAAWLLGNFLTLIGFNVGRGVQSIDDFRTFTELYLAADAASIAAGFLAYQVVKQTTAKQHEQAARAHA
jgi:hypothetical protein